MDTEYKLFRELTNGRQLLIGGRNELKQAERLIKSLKQYWPGDYSIKILDASARQPEPFNIAELYS